MTTLPLNLNALLDVPLFVAVSPIECGRSDVGPNVPMEVVQLLGVRRSS